MRGYYDSYTQKWLYTNEKTLGKLPLSLFNKYKKEISKMLYLELKKLFKDTDLYFSKKIPYSELIIFMKSVKNKQNR